MERKAPMSFAAIYAAILGRIVAGQYRPTHRIGIAALAEDLGVSTTPVREVLRQLAGRDIVVERHREGFYLAPLNARAIASFYAAHGLWMARAFDMASRQASGGRRPRNLWRLFDASAALTGDPALVAVRRYLDDRLVVLRRHESAVLGDFASCGTALARALASRDHGAVQAISVAFHADCAAQADHLADQLDPPSLGPAGIGQI